MNDQTAYRETARAPRSRWLVALLLATVLLNACSNVPSFRREGRGNEFEKATDTYGKYIRWGYFEEAAGYIRSSDGSPITVDLSRVARFRVSNYKILNRLLDDASREGRVVAVIEYYEIDSGVLKTVRDEQLWWHEADTGRWYLGSPMPAFGLAESD